VSRRWPWAAGGLVLAALALWTLARDASAPAAPPAAPAARKASPAVPPAVPAPLRAERNPFRFADEDDSHGPGGTRLPGAAARLEAPAPPTPAPGPRLVGLVRRGARTVAALTDGGEVELAGPGEAAAGVVVVAIGDEGVRIRRPDGTETVLPLP
jgi:hypothetical protein